MTVKYEVTDNKLVETLVFNGKTYTRTWNKESNMSCRCSDESFDVQLEKDGFDDAEFLDVVYDKLDIVPFDLMEVASYEERE